MNALFLPGNSPQHRVWVHDMATALGQSFETLIVQDYRHWQTGEAWADIDYELAQATTKMADLQPYVVFGKSIGALITLKGMYEGLLKPHACVLLGLPISTAVDMNLPVNDWLAAARAPIYFLQNENDPYGSADELRAMFPSNIDQTKIIVTSGNTHDYKDVTVIRKLLDRASA